MNIFNSPVAKRTRIQWQLFAQGFNGSNAGCCGSSRIQSRNRNRASECGSVQEVHEVIDVDDYSIDKRASKKVALTESKESCRKNRAALSKAKRVEESLVDVTEEEDTSENGSEGSSKSSRRKIDETKSDEESLADEYEEEQSNENASEDASILSKRHNDEVERILIEDSEEETHKENGSEGSSIHEEAKWIDEDELFVDIIEETNDTNNENESHHSMKETDGDKENNNIESAMYGSASSFKSGPHTYFLHSLDDSDSDDTDVTPVEEETDEDIPIEIMSSEDDEEYESSSSSSKSESDNWNNLEHLLANKTLYQPINMKESPKKKARKKVRSGSVERREKNHSAPKTNVKKANLKPMIDTSMCIDVDTYEKTNTKYKENVVRNQESLKPRSRAPRKDDGSFVDSLMGSIIANEDTNHKEGVIDLPLRFRFDDSEEESSSQITDESDMEGLFQEMDFAFQCEEIGSYKAQKVETLEKDDDEDNVETNRFKLCQHSDVYLEDQIGLRCSLCGVVILESRYVIPKLANYAPDKPKRSYFNDEQHLSTSDNVDFEGPDGNNLDNHNQIKGTVWELIPANIRAHLYPHQQEGFKFLWENLAGTTEISRLQKLDPRGGGGCIISHAPGTGKTLLTIVFLDTFLKKFPKCCPVIVAPVSMLLTWEAEFKKWQVGFSFLNLNCSEFLNNDKVMNGNFKCKKDVIRAMKISSWSNGGSVLGLSYSLYEKLVWNMKNKNLEKMGNVLLDKPGLVVLDEGHTPRNQRSNIWNALKKLKTKKRVILSGTPFQNNFRELFNTLHLVRPETAKDILNQKIFAEMMIRQRNKKKSRNGSASEDIQKLKAVISPFVHVHKGKILESKLLGLKSSVILLNPPPLQMRLIQNLGILAKTFEYEHRVALVSVHPSLILCKEKNINNKKELEKIRLQPDFGVKTRFVMELIRLSVPLNEKVLIFSQYIEPLKLLKDQIAIVFGWNEGRETMVIEGRINLKQRQMIINGFNDPNSEVKVLLASTRCCSEGIHLIGASRVVLLDVVWNPSVERQAISRAYRLGQKKVVYTYHLMTSGTTEEEKYARQVEKERLGELVFSSSSMAGEEPKNNEKVHAVKLNDKILQQMVEHEQLNSVFKEIRYPEKQATF